MIGYLLIAAMPLLVTWPVALLVVLLLQLLRLPPHVPGWLWRVTLRLYLERR